MPRQRKNGFIATDMHWDYAVILAFLGIAVPWLGDRRVRKLMQMPSITTIERLTLYGSTIAAQWVITALILWRTAIHRLSPGQLGIAVPHVWLTVEVSIGLSLLVLANQVFALRRLAAQPSEAKGLLPQLAVKIFPQTQVEQLAFVALVSTVAVCEETIFRGFVQRLFQDLAHGFVLAGILISAVFFSLAHLYQGRRGLASTFVIGVVFAAVRSWTGSLVPGLCAHFVADLTVGLLAPKRLRTVGVEEP